MALAARLRGLIGSVGGGDHTIALFIETGWGLGESWREREKAERQEDKNAGK